MDYMPYLNSIIGWGTAAVAVLFIGGIAISAYIYQKSSRSYYQFRVIVFGKDAIGNSTIDFDNGGIFTYGTTNLKLFYLKKHKVGLNPDKIKSVRKDKVDYVFLRKLSLKNFCFIDVTSLMSDNPSLEVTEQDVNWAIHDYRKHKALEKQSWLKEYIAPLIFIMTIAAILILMVWLFKKFDVIQGAAGALSEAAKQVKEAAQILANIKTGTQVIQP